MPRTPSPRARSTAVLVLLLVATAVVPRGTARAAEPPAVAGARHLAAVHGGSPNDYRLVEEAQTNVPHSDRPLWSGKFVDARTGDVRVVYHDPLSGATAGAELRAERAREAAQAVPAVERKADAELRAAIADQAAPGQTADGAAPGTVPVGVWLAVADPATDPATARADAADLAAARSQRAELHRIAGDARASVVEQFRRDVEALGGSIGYVSTMAPLVYVDMPPATVPALAELPAVSSLGLERTWVPTMTSAGPAVQADWSSGGDDLGSGVRVAVVEYHNVRNTGDLAGRVVASYSASGAIAYSPTFDHPTWVAGAIAGGGPFPGVAPGAQIVSASTGGGGVSVTRDRQIIQAADWAANPAGGDADVINASIGQDTATGSEEARRYFDALADLHRRLPVAAAGNLVTFGNWDIVSPGTAYNTLTVGGINDMGTADRGDDRVWFDGSNGSNYRDRTDVPWNTNGDYNKPNVSAPAVSVRTANGLSASGTSVASPIVAGIAAQLIARLPSLSLRPEATRAIIMASAIRSSPMPDGSRNVDHEGTGSASALWANRLLTNGDSPWGGLRMGDVTAGQLVTQEIAVRAGERVKVALSWNSQSTGPTSADRLMADLDLRVVQPNGATLGSFTYDNNYEWVEFTAAAAGTARIEIRQARFERPSERYGLAWAKWGTGTTSRIGGADRYATAALVSARHFGPGVPVVYVATGRNFPDALAAGPAAGIQGGPILLTDTASVPQPTRDELARLRPQRIVIVGGVEAVSEVVAGQLQAYTSQPVGRLAGANRFATAAAISSATFNPGVPAAFIATGRAFPDALAAGPAAIEMRGPVLLTEPGALPDSTRNELARLQPQRIFVLGGPAAVSDAVVAELRGYTGQIDRLAGADRFATAAEIAKALGTGDAPLTEGFLAWRAYVAKTPDLDCAKLLSRACPHLTPAEAAAYEAPFPDARAKAGVRRFPQLVPDRPDAPGAEISRRARAWLSDAWKGQTFMAIGAKDPVLGPPVMRSLARIIRGCPEPWLHADGGHFLQEWGEDVSRAALAAWK